MRQYGKTVRFDGDFSITELVDRRIDNTDLLVGYRVIGPGVNSTEIHSLESAHAIVDGMLGFGIAGINGLPG